VPKRSYIEGQLSEVKEIPWLRLFIEAGVATIGSALFLVWWERRSRQREAELDQQSPLVPGEMNCSCWPAAPAAQAGLRGSYVSPVGIPRQMVLNRVLRRRLR